MSESEENKLREAVETLRNDLGIKTWAALWRAADIDSSRWNKLIAPDKPKARAEKKDIDELVESLSKKGHKVSLEQRKNLYVAIGMLVDPSSEQDIFPRQRICPIPPPPPDHFGGRDKPLADLKLRLKEGKFTAITAVHGLGGIGKTTLARQLAHDLFYSDKTFWAVLWADFTSEPNPRQILLKWSAYAGFTPPADLETEQLVGLVKSELEGLIKECDTCQSGRVLVVLDDVWEKDKGAVRLLKLACPNGSTILLTTRNEGLGYDLGANMTSLDRLAKAEGIALLLEYLPEADTELLGKLSEVLGGHPLALSLAARRVLKRKSLTATEALTKHLKEYEQNLPALTEFESLKLDQGQSREDNLSLVLLPYTFIDPPKVVV